MEIPGFDDEADLEAALRDAGAVSWSVRVAAGRRLAGAALVAPVAEVVERLLLDDGDTAVCQETADALLRRRDLPGLRLVLAALAAAEEPSCPEPTIVDHLYGAVKSDPRWLSEPGQQELIGQIEELMLDPVEAVREQARGLHSRHAPRSGLGVRGVGRSGVGCLEADVERPGPDLRTPTTIAVGAQPHLMPDG